MASKAKLSLAWVAIILVAIFAVTRVFDYAVGSYKCWSKWSDSGMEYRYKVVAGCQIKPKEFWLPSENYRVD